MSNTWGNRHTLDDIHFYLYMVKLEEESSKLRKLWTNVVIALTHFGLVYNQTLAMKLYMYNKSSIQDEFYRDDEGSVLYKLLDKLKPGIIDGIIGGDTHAKMQHWEKNISMMSVPTHTRYLNIMYLFFKKIKKENIF